MKVLSTLSVALILIGCSAPVWAQININGDIADSTITLKEFNQKISNKQKAVLVYFSADWCTVCSKMKPVIERIEKEYANKMIILRVNTERDKEITNEFEIDALPVLILYKKSCTEWIHVGLLDSRTLHSEIDPFLNIIEP
ncbi:MAG: thioredoxin family protein [Bacteroidetes bacterium]|nr:thioredoxin family protein [Bacteroidota bacterium]